MSEKNVREHSSGSGGEFVYLVEARSTYIAPQECGGMIVDNRWRVIPLMSSPIGVKNDAYAAEARIHNRYLGYKAAVTLAHWFLAQAENGYCLQTRLVKIELTYSYSTKEIGVGAPISLYEQQQLERFVDRDAEPLSVNAVDPVDERVTE